MKNYLDHTIGFTAVLLLLLLGLSWVPDGAMLGGFSLRRMDLLADIRSEKPHTPEFTVDTLAYAPEDTLALSVPDTLQQDSTETFAPLPPKDSSYYGARIEDYTYDQSGLARFFAAIDSVKYGRTVRVAWYGDSFVEGDILIGDLRDTLQTLWGGRGVGFVPITSEVAQFKRTLKHRFQDWTTFSIIKKSEYRPKLGLNGYAYQAQPSASVVYEGAHYFKNTQRWTQSRLFYTAAQPCRMEYQLQDRASHGELLKSRGDRLSSWKWEGSEPGTDFLRLQFPETDGLMVYGASLESGPGIYIDNFSVRGNSGGPLKLLQPDFIRQFDAVQKYDLVVLQVGLNAVTNGLTNIRWYQAELERTYHHLRECFPNQPILIVSVGDRGGKSGAELVTMRGVPAIVSMQRELARRHGFLFYDLFYGIGGPGAMIRFSMQRPRLANADYTHLTHEGGRVVGYKFAHLLLEEQQRARRSRSLQ